MHAAWPNRWLAFAEAKGKPGVHVCDPDLSRVVATRDTFEKSMGTERPLICTMTQGIDGWCSWPRTTAESPPANGSA
jgi:hypothetical protein